MLSAEEKAKVRPKYFKMVRQTTGWKVAYDDLKELDNPIFDVSVFLTKDEVDEKTGEKNRLYGFFQTTYNSNVSYDAFYKASLNPAEGGLAKIADIIDSQIYPYGLDDVIAQLLHLGYHIQDVYKPDENGKNNLNLNPDMLHEMIHQFCTQNSPLLDPASAPRPNKLKLRNSTPTKKYWNVDRFGKNGPEKIPESER